MAELTYRDAVAAGIAQEMARDERVVFLGEDVAHAGGVFKATVGLLDKFGPKRVRDTPISEQAILGAAMGAAMTGLRPIAEIMFSDFLAVCWDIVANEIAKSRYMTNGQVQVPLVIRTANGAGSRFGAQHSQSVENWAMAVPGLKVIAPSTPADVKGLLAAAVRDPDPVVFFESQRLYPEPETVVKGGVLPEPDRSDIVGQDRPYLIGPFDKLVIDVFGIKELSEKEVQTDASGRISFPLAGTVEAAGKTPAEVEEVLEERLRGAYVRDPQVTVNLKETVSQVVTVDGEVKEPGLYPVVGKLTLMRAVATAKGATEFAALSNVTVFRTVKGQKMAALYSLKAIRNGIYDDPEVFANDVIVVGDSQARRIFKDVLQASPLITTPLLILFRAN